MLGYEGASNLLVYIAHSSGFSLRHSVYFPSAFWYWPFFTKSFPSCFSAVKRTSAFLSERQIEEVNVKFIYIAHLKTTTVDQSALQNRLYKQISLNRDLKFLMVQLCVI